MDKFHRRSIRLRGYDYAQNGYYFVTICPQNREEIFGTIHDGLINLSTIGEMIRSWWERISIKFEGIQIDNYVIMPNHIHGIVQIVGANPCIRPIKTITQNNQGDNVVSPLQDSGIPNKYDGLGRYISWFKRMSTNEYIHRVKVNNWPRFNKRLWQRNYYEHIIRNEKDYFAIKQYIKDNPKNWEKDELNRE